MVGTGDPAQKGMEEAFMAKAVFIALMSGLLAASPLFAQPSGSASGIDWGVDAITVIGVGQPPPNPANLAQARAMTIRAALNDAAQSLTAAIQGIAVQGELTVGALMTANEAVRVRIESLVKGAWQTGPPDYRPDGSIALTVFIKRSDVAGAVLPEAGFAASMPSPAPPPSGVQTGLTIDARGLDLTPALVCKVLDDKGREVYGAASVTREYAVRAGVTGYAKALGKNERVGPNPLSVKAAGVAGPNRTDVVLSQEDAERVRVASQAYNFLGQGRVLILID